MRRQREEERQKALQQAQLQRQREEEAEARRALRRQQPSQPAAAPVAAKPTEGVWRRGAPVTPASPTRAAVTPPRAESPANASKFRPPALRGDGAAAGGWRARRDAAAQQQTAPGASTPQRPASPAVVESPKASKDDDGFQTVPANKGVWRPSRGRGRGGL